MEGFPSGQREQTVNLPCYALRRFKSFPLHHEVLLAGIAQLAEHQPSKLRVASSNLVARSKEKSCSRAHVAQSAEHFLGKEEVISSILIMGSITT